jgi:hypothetical protein
VSRVAQAGGETLGDGVASVGENPLLRKMYFIRYALFITKWTTHYFRPRFVLVEEVRILSNPREESCLVPSGYVYPEQSVRQAVQHVLKAEVGRATSCQSP